MSVIEKINVSSETLQEHKDVLQSFLTIGNSVWLFATTELSNHKLIYNHAGVIDGLITVISYLKDRHGSGFESIVPVFSTIKELEEWVYINYVEEIKLRKSENKLTADQLQSYDKELQAMERDIAKRKNWETNRIAGIDISYAASRWLTIGNDNPGKLIHKTIEHALTFIPKQNTMLANTLNDAKIKKFIETHQQQIALMKPILSLLPKVDQDLQSAIFANLLVCTLDASTVANLTSKLSTWIKSQDYYEFVKYLGELVLSYAKNKWESHMGAKSTREGISFADLKIGELHDKQEIVWLQWIHKPNQTILPEDSIDLRAFLARNPDVSLFEILLANK